MLDFTQLRVETFQCSFTRKPGKFCTPFNSLIHINDNKYVKLIGHLQHWITNVILELLITSVIYKTVRLMQITDSEKHLMDVLWKGSTKAQPMTAKQIIEFVDPKLEWHDKTIKTLINRLLKKDAIGFKKKGREYLYYPILKEQDYVKDASDNFLQRVFKGNVSSLVTSFAKKENLSAKDIEELKVLISELEK